MTAMTPTHWMLIAANAYLGRMEEAKNILLSLEKYRAGIILPRIRRDKAPISAPD